MSGLVAQQKADEKAQRDAELQRELDAHNQAVRDQQVGFCCCNAVSPVCACSLSLLSSLVTERAGTPCLTRASQALGLTVFSHVSRQSYEHENLHMTFEEKYELFKAENESKNIDAREHVLATREDIQVCPPALVPHPWKDSHAATASVERALRTGTQGHASRRMNIAHARRRSSTSSVTATVRVTFASSVRVRACGRALSLFPPLLFHTAHPTRN